MHPCAPRFHVINMSLELQEMEFLLVKMEDCEVTITDRTGLLTPLEAGRHLGGYSPAALAQLRYTGAGPQFVKLSSRAVRYRLDDLNAWVESRLRTSTADHSPAA